MPIYEYECKQCGHLLEVIQKINDTPLTECPKCHEAGLHKIVSATQFQLKGSGWYVTDFKTKSAPKTETKTSATETETKQDAEKKTETKESSSKDTDTT